MVDLEFVGDYRNPQQLTARQRELGHDGQSDGDFTFDDFLDIINPLQHIPLVSTLYREITGDEISPHARILGDTLFGGASGFVTAAANVFFEEVAGEDIGETVLAFFSGEEEAAEQQFAGNDGPAAANPAAPNPAAPDPLAAGTVVPAAAPLTTAADSSLPGAPSHPYSPADLPDLPQGGAPQGNLPLQESDAASGMLTGEAALNALFNDLRGTPAAGPARPAETAPAQERQAAALPPQPRRGGSSASALQSQAAGPAAEAPTGEQATIHPLILAQDSGEADIAGQMMQALDKYRMMSRQGGSDSASDAEAAQRRSEPASHDAVQADPWNFDPATPPAGS